MFPSTNVGRYLLRVEILVQVHLGIMADSSANRHLLTKLAFSVSSNSLRDLRGKERTPFHPLSVKKKGRQALVLFACLMPEEQKYAIRENG